ncbi:MAG: glycosyltransferase family 2 protein [Thermoanaerobaculia bacterium]
MPAFNEAGVIAEVVEGVRAVYPRVVVVDDGSTDETRDWALAAGATVLRHLLNRGQGASLQTGIEYALSRGAECVVTFDSDGQHQVGDVAQLIEPIAQGEAEICLGSRFLDGRTEVPALRRWLLRGAVVFTHVFSGLGLTDAHNGLRAFSRRAALEIDLRQDRMAHASELVDQIRRMGLPFREVPVTVLYTEYSIGKGQRGVNAFRIVLDYLIGRILG